MSTDNENFMRQFLDERLNQYDKFFTSALWKKSLLPFLRAHREVAANALLSSRDHIEGDIQKGRVIAFDSIINLPKALDYRQKQQTEGQKQGFPEQLPQPITDAFEGLANYEPEQNWEGE